MVAANREFYAAFNRRDLEAMYAVWARSGEVTCIHPGWDVLAGPDLVLGSYAALFENPSQGRIVAGGESVAIIGEVAVVVCREFASGSPLAATNVFVRQDGAWKLVHHQAGQVMARFE